MDTAISKKNLNRDGRGRFAKKTVKPVEAVKVEIPETKAKSFIINGEELLNMFDRNTSLPKKSGSIFLKIINKEVPDVYNTRGTLVRNKFVLEEKYLNVTSVANYDYLCVQYMSTRGHNASFYCPIKYEFELVTSDHPDYQEVTKSYDAIFIRTLSNRLAHSFNIGSDPEIFVENEDGSLIPAFKFLPSKKAPAYTPNDVNQFSYYGNCTMYWDGYQAEFTTKDNRCLGHHGDSIAAGLRGVYDAARKVYPNAKLSLRSVFHLDADELANAAEEHVEFGCMPSKNAYGLKVEMPPARVVPFRSAGGHIHFGVGKDWHQFAEPMVKALDAILGVACVSLFAEFDDPSRRRLYGLPGEYRTPEHGIEYRPLSNAWLCHPMIMNLVMDLSRKALMFGKNGFMKYWNATEEETISCIIDCDVEAAHRILERNKECFKQILQAAYPGRDTIEIGFLYDVFINGIRSAINDPNDFVTNWKLHTGWEPHAAWPRRSGPEPNVYTYLQNRRKNDKYKM